MLGSYCNIKVRSIIICTFCKKILTSESKHHFSVNQNYVKKKRLLNQHVKTAVLKLGVATLFRVAKDFCRVAKFNLSFSKDNLNLVFPIELDLTLKNFFLLFFVVAGSILIKTTN
jgi:hypothetical protein